MQRKLMLFMIGLCLVFTLTACGQTKNGSGQEQAKQSQEDTGQGGAGSLTVPNFSLSDLQGKQVQLSDFKGKKVLINFWATWCSYCKEEMPLIQAFHEHAGDNNWQVLTVNLTDSEKGIDAVQSYIEQNNYTFPVLLDEKGKVSGLYKIRSIPASFVLDEKGKLIQTKVGSFTEKEMDKLKKL